MPTVSEYIDGIDEPLASVARSLRAVIEKSLPRASAAIWHGHPVWMNGETVIAGLHAYSDRVTFMLWEGQNAGDTSGELIEGDPGNMATRDYSTVSDIDTEKLNAWLSAVNVT